VLLDDVLLVELLSVVELVELVLLVEAVVLDDELPSMGGGGGGGPFMACVSSV